MLKDIFIILFIFSFGTVSAQFSLDVKDYGKQQSRIDSVSSVKDSLRKVALSDENDRRFLNNDLRYKLRWGNMITLKQSVGIVQSSYNLSYCGYIISDAKWIIPVSVKLSGSNDYNKDKFKKGYKDWSNFCTTIGLSAFTKIKSSNFYFGLGGGLPLGIEKYRKGNEEDKHTHVYTGLSVEERILYIDSRSSGLVLGFGIYQDLLTSKLYNFDFGFSFEIGYKF